MAPETPEWEALPQPPGMMGLINWKSEAYMPLVALVLCPGRRPRQPFPRPSDPPLPLPSPPCPFRHARRLSPTATPTSVLTTPAFITQAFRVKSRQDDVPFSFARCSRRHPPRTYRRLCARLRLQRRRRGQELHRMASVHGSVRHYSPRARSCPNIV